MLKTNKLGAVMALLGLGFGASSKGGEFPSEQPRRQGRTISAGFFNRDPGKDKRKRPVWLQSQLVLDAEFKRDRKNSKRGRDNDNSWLNNYYLNW